MIIRTILILLFYFLPLLGQSVIKSEEYAQRIHHINSDDSFVYLLLESGLEVLFYNYSSKQHEFRNMIEMAIKPNSYSIIRGDELLLHNEDKIAVFDISERAYPRFITELNSDTGLTKISPFGPYYIFHYGESSKMVSFVNSNFYFVCNISIENLKLIDYPFVIISYSNQFNIYQYSVDSSFSFYKTLYDTGIVSSGVVNNKLTYMTWWSNYNMPPNSRLKTVDISLPQTPVINYKYWNSLHTGTIKQCSEQYFVHNFNSVNEVYEFNGPMLEAYKDIYKIHLGKNRYYAYKDGILYCNGKMLNFIYSTFPLTGRMLQISASRINLLSNGSDNILKITDSLAYWRSIFLADSVFFVIWDDLSLRRFSILGDSIVVSLYAGNMLEPFDSKGIKMFDAGNYIAIMNINSFYLYKRQNNYSRIFQNDTFLNVKKMVVDDTLLYLCDAVRGIVALGFTQYSAYQKWNWPGPGNFSMEVYKGNFLIRKSNQIFILDKSQSINQPVFSRTFNLPGDYTYTDLIVTESSLYLKGIKDNIYHLIKLELDSAGLSLKYTIPLDYSDFTIAENGGKIIAFSGYKIYWISDPDILSVDEYEPEPQHSFVLHQNYPNPFNPVTLIKYQVPEDAFVTIKIFDSLGREIKTLVSSPQKAGRHEVNFDASNYSSGVYLYKMQANNYISTKKMVLLK